MVLTFEKIMISGMLFMIVISGLSIFVGGIYPEYSGATVNDSFSTNYDRMSEIYKGSNALQSNLIKNDTVEGDPSKDFNLLDAFGVIKDSFLKVPKILFHSLAIMIAPPSASSSGGVLFTFSQTLGIPPTLMGILIAIATVSVSLLIIKSILGRK